ncbi:MAG: glutaredoxin domain-containing protein [Actinomycetota bacterium]|nr:glutaredoxin domain-containing protein [Actinomycetota bacterium]
MTYDAGAADDAPPLPDGLGGGAAVTVMWRPGCPFCSLLLRRLERTGLVFDRIDIWDEPAAAAWVRTVADGNETVPTVRVAGAGAGAGDGRAVALVNPSATEVLDQLARLAPDRMPSAPRASSDAAASGPAASGRLARLAAGLRARFRGRRDRDRGRAAPR